MGQEHYQAQLRVLDLKVYPMLEDHIERKLNKLENYYDKIVECKVFLKVENKSDKENKSIKLLRGSSSL